ncbi:hypothetical protein PQQ52_17525 [Paraburkholderia sediminicola]|uniref:hypothetical protein n=1 Tax=Paraburkholderia sediminicola TaxID=458836 RepID=UPI0038B80C36
MSRQAPAGRQSQHVSRAIENWRGALEFVMFSHAGETFLRAMKMMRRLRKSLLSFGVEAQQPFGRRLRRRRSVS